MYSICEQTLHGSLLDGRIEIYVLCLELELESNLVEESLVRLY